MSRARKAPVTWATVRAEFEAAITAERATWARDENKIGGPPSPEALRYRAAYQALMAFPAPDAAGLALKIASHHGSPDFEDFDETLPHAAEWLAIYNNAVALAPPASWPSVAARLGKVLGWTFGVEPGKASEFRRAEASTDKAERLLASAYRAASVAEGDQPAAVIATSLLEELGQVFAADIFPQYVCNPGALADIAQALCSAQADARDLLRETDGLALGAIYRDVTFAKQTEPTAADLDECAKIDFEATPVDLKLLPTAETLGSAVLPQARLSAAMLGKSKGEMIDAFGTLTDDELEGMVASMESAEHELSGLASIIRTAVARVRIASIAGAS